MKKTTVEICCGSYYDAKQAWAGGATRIELNSALHLGGLTPTTAVLKLVKQATDLKIICMVRPRGGGFCYEKDDFETMLIECRNLMEAGADGIAFGCLNHNLQLDLAQNQQLLAIINEYHGESVFHRAFDCVADPYETTEQLIALGVDRILTSGLQSKAMDGADCLKQLQTRYGSAIELLAGSGVNTSNARTLVQDTGISQVHSSCKSWKVDPSTCSKDVSFAYAATPHEQEYEVVSAELVEQLILSLQ